MMGLEINYELLPLKGHYFLFNAATAPVVPFIPVFARQLGYSTVIVGIIYFILPIVGLLAKPFFGAIADRFHRQKFIFLFFQAVVLVAFIAVLAIPAIPSNAQFHCHEGETLIEFSPPNIHQISDCTINQVITNKDNSTFECDLKCTTNDEWKNVCPNWNLTGICDSNLKIINISTRVGRNRITKLNDTFYMIFHNGTVGGQQSTMFCPGNKKDENIFKMNCLVECYDETINEVMTGATDEQVKSTFQFWTFFFLLILSWAGMAVVVSVGDAICFEMLGDKPQRYGHQRLWGSVGWGTLSIISGYMIDKFSEGQTTKNYAVGFYLMAGLVLLDMLVSSRLKYSQTKISSNILKDVGRIFSSMRVVVFFLWCVTVGLGTAGIWNFLFWHLEDLAAKQAGCDFLSSIKTLEGLVMAIQCFGGELPFFFISGKLLKAIGHVHAMSLVLLGFAVRFMCYSFLENPWYVLPIELLNGVTFGIFYATMTSYASILALPGTEATMQGLVGAVFEGVGVSIGSLVGGMLMNSRGGSEMFLLFAYVAFACFIGHVAIQWLLTKLTGPYDLRQEYVQPYNSIATDAFSILDDSSDFQTEIRK